MAIKRLLVTSLLLASSAAHAASFVVSNIKVEGLQRVALGAVLLKMPVRIGDTIDDADTATIIKSLYSTGNFDDITVSHDDTVLIVDVKERPTIANISFSGNKAIEEEQLQDNLNASSIRVGEALDRTKLSTIEKGLEDFYYSVGKYNATVNAVITPLPRNRADLKFVFSEGVSAKVKQVNIIGNEVFTDDELLSRFDLTYDLSWWQFLSDDKYQKQVLAADIENLRTFYFDRGYLKFQVTSSQVSITPDKKGVYVTLNVDEGKPYTVDKVNFRGDLIGMEDEFDALIPFKEGDTYNGSAVTGLEEDVKKLLGEAGYAYPKVQTIPEFDDNLKKVTLTMQVDPGSRIYVRDISFTGNTITKDEVLRREMRQMESSWLNSKSIDTGKARLNRLGFFETVDVKTQRVPGSPDQVDLVYNVKEANSGNINFGLGYGTESGISFQIGLQQDNFMGTGNKVGITAMTNDYQDNISLTYRDPYWTVDGVSLGGKVFYNKFEASDAGIVDYTNESYGTSVSWGFPVDELNYIETGLGYTHNKISNLDAYVQIEKFLEAQEDENFDGSTLKVDDFDVNISWTRNNLNKGYFPTEGNYQRASAKMTLPGSDVPYYKLQYDVKQYIPITEEHDYTLLMRGRLGYGNGYGDTNGNDNLFPFYENFYMGGFSTLRGFSNNSAGPKAVYDQGGNNGGNNTNLVATDESVGGNATWVVSLEMIVPTPFVSDELKNSIRTSVFLDVASVWDTEFDYNKNAIAAGDKYFYDYSDPWEYRASYGLALQWVSPLGPLVFSVAKPIEEYDGDDEEFFSFTIGKTF